jgi:hypothetical protein
MSIKFDQTLHGYVNGHSLLRSSIRLSSEVDRLMLGMSDMSGPGMRPGFELYLTAYPLPSEDTYVIARTWYAPEMQRPGCVWTHSLLIPKHDLGKIGRGQSLLRLFHRPASISAIVSYGTRLVFDDESDQQDDSANPEYKPSDDLALEALMRSVYGQTEKPVYVLARHPREHESMILALWSQQWPQLRGAFSFCTGALASRTLGGKPLDLQIVPRDAASEQRQELAKGIIVDGTALTPFFAASSGSSNTEWLSVAIRDLERDYDHRVRQIAWDLAIGSVADRASFPAIFHAASLVQWRTEAYLTAAQYTQAIAATAAALMMPTSLLKSLLGPPENSDVRAFSERDLLEALSNVPISGVLAPKDLDISGRARRLWQKDRPSALELFSALIARDSTSEIGNEILVSICQALEPDDLEIIAKGRPGILNAVIKQKPQLASSPAIWLVNQNSHVEMFRSVMSAPLDASTLEPIVGAVLLSNSDTVPEHAFEYGDRLVEPALQWLNANASESRLSAPWARYFRSYTDTSIAWLKIHSPTPTVLAALASILPADAPSIMSMDLRTWEPLLHSLDNMNEREAVPVAAFLFALGLRHCEPLAVEFVRECFATVHDAADETTPYPASSSFPYDSWRPIASVAPSLTYWREWDKCERMRAALLDRFISCGWPCGDLLRAVKTSKTLLALFSLSDTTKARKRFLRETAKMALKSGTMPEYRRILEGYK